MLADYTGTMSFGKDTKGKQRLVITDLDGVSHEYLIPKDKHVLVHDGQVVNKGESIVDGAPDPHDILRLQGVEALAIYITDEVQDVYRLQGNRVAAINEYQKAISIKAENEEAYLRMSDIREARGDLELARGHCSPDVAPS